jgi:formate--tetrahydrofolate ligase
VGLGRRTDGVPRQTRFDITAASELMAILALSRDLADLRERLGRTVVAYDRHERPVTAEEVGGAGAMAVLLRDALDPNLLQTLEGTPALVHTGPFANIAHGNSSLVADMVGVRGADYLITEAGFGADIGAEKFFNIKCRASGLRPDAAVVVTTVRALKSHSGEHRLRAGRPLPASIHETSPEQVLAGADNLRHHIAIVRRHGVSPVVAINAFPGDHAGEHDAIASVCDDLGVRWAVADPHGGGGAGCTDLARAVAAACDEGSDFRMLYPDDLPLRDKIEAIATGVYGADGVTYDLAAERMLDRFEEYGWGHLPICMAKTQMSISHDKSLLGAPRGWTLPIREVRASVGAGFVLPLAGDISTMPGLGAHPAAMDIDIDEHGEVVGLF